LDGIQLWLWCETGRADNCWRQDVAWTGRLSLLDSGVITCCGSLLIDILESSLICVGPHVSPVGGSGTLDTSTLDLRVYRVLALHNRWRGCQLMVCQLISRIIVIIIVVVLKALLVYHS